MPDPVVKTIDVPCDRATAFRIFTAEIDRWWPKHRHSVSAMRGGVARAVRLEPREGGALTETDQNGAVITWGSVARFDPCERLELRWHAGRPEAEATLVEVTFVPQAQGTRVTLRHHGWEALGAEAEKSRDGYDAGWVGVFEQAYAGACAAATRGDRAAEAAR